MIYTYTRKEIRDIKSPIQCSRGDIINIDNDRYYIYISDYNLIIKGKDRKQPLSLLNTPKYIKKFITNINIKS